MPKVPWRVGRVVNKGSLTSLLRTSALMIGGRDQPRGESGESAPGLSVSRSPAGAIDRPAPLLSRRRHEVGIVVKGDGRRRVPRPLGEGDDRLSRLRDEERACVPQHVERVLRYGLPLPCLRSPSLLVSAVVITPFGAAGAAVDDQSGTAFTRSRSTWPHGRSWLRCRIRTGLKPRTRRRCSRRWPPRTLPGPPGPMACSRAADSDRLPVGQAHRAGDVAGGRSREPPHSQPVQPPDPAHPANPAGPSFEDRTGAGVVAHPPWPTPPDRLRRHAVHRTRLRYACGVVCQWARNRRAA